MRNRNTKLTSTNSKKIPAIINEISMYLENAVVFDFGCGRYWENTRNFIFRNGGAMYTPYDKYWEIGDIPVIPAEYTHIICANVLNVIEDEYEMYEALTTIKDISSDITIICIQIYEGNKSGIGEETSKGYQRNEKTEDYIKRIESIFNKTEYAINKKRNYIIIDKLPW